MNFNNLFGLGSAYQVAGDDNRAAEFFLRALEERPNAHWVHRNLCAAFFGAGRRDEALSSAKKLMQVHPNMTVKRFKEAMVF